MHMYLYNNMYMHNIIGVWVYVKGDEILLKFKKP